MFSSSSTDMKVDGGLQGGLEAARRELQALKVKVEKMDDTNARLLLEKLEEEEKKEKAKQDMVARAAEHDRRLKEFSQSLHLVQDEVQRRSGLKQQLLDQRRRSQEELEARRARAVALRRQFQISAQIPETEVKFLHQQQEEGGASQPIRGVFTVSQRGAVLLKGGQALLTFEEEKVASQVLQVSRCLVSCEDTSVEVRPRPVVLDPAVKFQVHLTVSRKQLHLSGLPASLPEERAAERLELSFSRPSRGGAEVERAEYRGGSGTGTVTFLLPGAAERLALIGRYRVHLETGVDVRVAPSFQHRLQMFQTFCCVTKRSVLLDNIRDVEDEEDLQDHLEIHFQKPSNSGGEIESIRYVSGGTRLRALFSQDVSGDEDA